jgi:deoxyuridine 5'-triphosphate nucleotidohydrolase
MPELVTLRLISKPLFIMFSFAAPRSGLAVKNFIDVGAGVVDYDYRGNVGVVLFNHGEEDFVVKRGDRVAQLILERICTADAVEVDELPGTERGEGGFGSTGVCLTSSVNQRNDDNGSQKKPRIGEEN